MSRIFDFLFNFSNNTRHRNYARWMWYAVLVGLASIFLLFLILSFSNLPSVQQLENPKSEEATQIYAATGEVLGRYYTENRVPVSYEQLDPDLVNALIATEDERYYQHSGIDFQALARVAVKTVFLRQESSGGGSTITQQLAKLLFTGTPGTRFQRVLQKLREWIIAVRLERKYTKEEIIAMYLNKFDFLYRSDGIKAASENYFGKTQDSLQVHEAALLVGMLKNPSLYNPIRFPERALKRREVVLSQMKKNNVLSEAAYDTLRSKPLGIEFSQNTHIDGLATYFRMELAKDVKTILQKEENLKSDGTPYDLYKDGLKIYTTIDPEMQRIAEQTMYEHMKAQQKTFFKEWKGKDPWTYVSNPEEDFPVAIRQTGLKRLIRSTDRYQNLREKYLGDLLEELRTEFPRLTFNPDDREIERIVQEYEEPGSIAQLVTDGMISGTLASRYRQVLKSNSFPKVRTQWEKLQEVVDEVFNSPVKMKVFTWDTPKHEKDSVMSPLDSIKYHRMHLQTGVLAVDPKNGHVKVWVGGIDQKYFQFDHIRTSRQVGSTFKPFIYATAIDQQGISPCYQVYDLPQTIRPGDGNFFLLKEWTPENFSGEYTGQLLTLKEGLRRSKNTVSVFLMKQLGDTEPVRNLVHNMGIDTSARYPNGRYRLPNSPSICLGATDLTVMEMAGAYTTFANNGIHNKPLYIMRIEDKNGRVIYEGIQQENRALPPNSNFVMVEMLRHSGKIGNQLYTDAGGKTGTTNDYVDGWFMGITPNLVVGTWVGGEDRWIAYRTPWNGQGSRMAKPFFVKFIRNLEKSDALNWDQNAKFFRPAGDIGIELNCDEYQTDDIDVDDADDFNEDPFSEDMFGDEFGGTTQDSTETIW